MRAWVFTKINYIKDLIALLKTVLWTRWFFKSCGWRCRLQISRLMNPQNIEIGERVNILYGCRLEACTQYAGVCHKPRIVIGSRVSIGQNFHCTCSEYVEIGDDVSITANVTISDTIHPYEDVSQPIERCPLKSRPVRIGAETKINNGAVIMPGVTIGRHCSIGANSVVTRDVPDYSVVVGNPGRVVKHYNPLTDVWERVE